jgi:hypothetical protein
MVIINYKGGQLGNRMLLFAHFMANSLEYGYALYNPEFNEYIPYFEGSSGAETVDTSVSVSRWGNRRIDKLISLLLRGWTDITHRITKRNKFYRLYRIFKTHDRENRLFDLNEPGFVKDAREKNTIVQGWLFRDHRHIEKHHAAISAYFTPVLSYRNEVDSVIQQARKAGDILIGVHIRRGDYVRFANGQYFFTDAVYAEKMALLSDRYAREGKKSVFVLCSNDAVDLKAFPPDLTVLFEKRHFITDMYALAACDAILGPPSTFSIWASYYGQVPLMQLDSRDYLPEPGAYISRC